MNSIDLRQFGKRSTSRSQARTGTWMSFLNKEIHLFGKRFDDRRKQIFFMELHSMLSSGVNLKAALEIIIVQESVDALKSKFKVIEQRVVEGQSLSEALRLSQLFSSYEHVTVKTGEETGKLAEVIKALSLYYSDRIRQKRQIVAAVSYPAVILIFSFLVVIFLMAFMIPMFQSVFTKFNNDLPASTMAVFAVSNSLRSIWLELAIVVVCLSVVYARTRNGKTVREFQIRLVSNLPFFGAIYRGIAIGSFCRSMSFLISSRVPLNRCIQLQCELCTYSPIRNALPLIEEDLVNGSPLYTSFRRVAVFNVKLIAMVRIGEEINQLERFFDNLALQYASDADFRIAQMNALLEPLLIIFLGVVVGFILITMYLPMFEISNSFNQ